MGQGLGCRANGVTCCIRVAAVLLGASLSRRALIQWSSQPVPGPHPPIAIGPATGLRLRSLQSALSGWLQPVKRAFNLANSSLGTLAQTVFGPTKRRHNGEFPQLYFFFLCQPGDLFLQVRSALRIRLEERIRTRSPIRTSTGLEWGPSMTGVGRMADSRD